MAGMHGLREALCDNHNDSARVGVIGGATRFFFFGNPEEEMPSAILARKPAAEQFWGYRNSRRCRQGFYPDKDQFFPSMALPSRQNSHMTVKLGAGQKSRIRTILKFTGA